MYCNSCHPYQGYNTLNDYWTGGNWMHHWNGYNHYETQTNLVPFNWNIVLRDYGKSPFVVNIDHAAKQNDTFRTALWTGEHFQVTLMSIRVGDDIGLEIHPETDQFIRIEQGQAIVQMGESKEKLDFQAMACEGYAIMIPAGKWHNIINTGNIPLKVYVIYAPPHHPYGTVHVTKADAAAAK